MNDKPKYRYNWKTGKADELYRVERPHTEIQSALIYLRNMREAQRMMNSAVTPLIEYDETIH